eukprot:8248312-Alexandrium_andersonii.AAC.1
MARRPCIAKPSLTACCMQLPCHVSRGTALVPSDGLGSTVHDTLLARARAMSAESGSDSIGLP